MDYEKAWIFRWRNQDEADINDEIHIKLNLSAPLYPTIPYSIITMIYKKIEIQMGFPLT